MIAIGPATLLPTYTFNFELCYDRNIILGFNLSLGFQVTIAICSLLFILYLAVITKIFTSNARTKNINSLYCLELINRVSKIIGICFFGLISILSIIALLAVEK